MTPKTIETVLDLRSVLYVPNQIVDVWYHSTGGGLQRGVVVDYLELNHMNVQGTTIDDLREWSQGLPDDLPVRTFVQGVEKDLVAVGPEGENVDFSFNIVDRV